MLGCAALPDRVVPAAPPPAAKIHASWTGCRSTGASAHGDRAGTHSDSGPSGTGSVPAGFTATTALLCSDGESTSANGDTVQTEVEGQADDITALLAYLARPSEVSTHPDRLVCAAMAWKIPWLFLRDADGRWIAPAIPEDSCGFALDLFSGAGPAYTLLKYHDRVVRRGRVLESAAAKASGCEMDGEDVVTAEGAQATHRPLTTADLLGVAEVRVCVYRVPAAERTSSSPSGSFLRGRVLDPAQRQTVLDALTGTSAATARCTAPASRFAVLQTTQGDLSLYVELDGCRRILLFPSTGSGAEVLTTGDAALTRAIDAVSR